MRIGLWRRVFVVLLAGLLFPVLPALGQNNGNGNGNGNGKAKGHDKHKKDTEQQDYQRYYFRPEDRKMVTAYYSKHKSGLPPGLAKRNGDLPPGLEKQLQRNGQLPPGLEKKLAPCPVEVVRQLPPIPPDYQRSVIGANIIIFDKRTNIIVDVMQDVVR
jgi:hypothetical protein